MSEKKMVRTEKKESVGAIDSASRIITKTIEGHQFVMSKNLGDALEITVVDGKVVIKTKNGKVF